MDILKVSAPDGWRYQQPSAASTANNNSDPTPQQSVGSWQEGALTSQHKLASFVLTGKRYGDRSGMAQWGWQLTTIIEYLITSFPTARVEPARHHVQRLVSSGRNQYKHQMLGPPVLRAERYDGEVFFAVQQDCFHTCPAAAAHLHNVHHHMSQPHQPCPRHKQRSSMRQNNAWHGDTDKLACVRHARRQHGLLGHIYTRTNQTFLTCHFDVKWLSIWLTVKL